MKSQLNKWMFAWNIALTIMLLIALAATATMAQASNDPPVKVFTATMDDIGSDGIQTSTDTVIDSTAQKSLLFVETPKLSTSHPHICTVIASAEATRTNNANGVYVFSLAMDNAGAATSSERRAEFTANQGFDQRYEEVSTIFTYTGVTGNHTFRFFARKEAAGAADMTVSAASITVICLRKIL